MPPPPPTIRALTGGYDCPNFPTCREDNDCDTNIFGKCHQHAAVGVCVLAAAALVLLAELAPLPALLLQQWRRRRRRVSGCCCQHDYRAGDRLLGAVEACLLHPWARQLVRAGLGTAIAVVAVALATVHGAPSFALLEGADVEERGPRASVWEAGAAVSACAVLATVVADCLPCGPPSAATVVAAKVVLELGLGLPPAALVTADDLTPSLLRRLADGARAPGASSSCGGGGGRRRRECGCNAAVVVYVGVHLVWLACLIALALVTLRDGACHHSTALRDAFTAIVVVRVVQVLSAGFSLFRFAYGRAPCTWLHAMLAAACVLWVTSVSVPEMFQELAFANDVVDMDKEMNSHDQGGGKGGDGSGGNAVGAGDGSSVDLDDACPVQALCWWQFVTIVAPLWVGVVYLVRAFAALACAVLCGSRWGGGGGGRGGAATAIAAGDAERRVDVLKLLDVWTETQQEENGEETAAPIGWECSICLDHVDGQAVQLLPCRHMFHRACLEHWMVEYESTCPLCKADLAARLIEEVMMASGAGDSGDGDGNGTATESVAIELQQLVVV